MTMLESYLKLKGITNHVECGLGPVCTQTLTDPSSHSTMA